MNYLKFLVVSTAIGVLVPSPVPIGQAEDAAEKLSPCWVHCNWEVISNYR